MLKVTDIKKSFKSPEGKIEILKGISFNVDAGEFVAVQGTSGCGKTTLLLTIGGLMAPDSGEVLLNDLNPYYMSKEQQTEFRSQEIGFVFQQFHLMPYLNVIENILIPTLVPAKEDLKPRAEELIDKFGLRSRVKHLPSKLSIGERQRTALARALLRSPKLILADEPTGNLDEDNATIVIEQLRSFAAEGGHVLMVTHSNDAAKMADRVIDIQSVNGN